MTFAAVSWERVFKERVRLIKRSNAAREEYRTPAFSLRAAMSEALAAYRAANPAI